MKFLTLLLSLTFASNLYAEMQTSFCNAIDGGALSVQFDEAKQIVIVNKIPQTKVTIDEKSMRFWNDKYAYTFNRENGAMMVYLEEEVVGVLECSIKK
jgi:frataxin-like iron-binding protein CyaY